MTGSRLAELLGLLVGQAKSDDERDAIYRLRDLVIRSVDVVDRGANKRRFLIVKRGDLMDTKDDLTFGPAVVEGPGGELTAAPVELAPAEVEKTIDVVEVAKVHLNPAAKATMLKVLTEISERIASLVVQVRDATEREEGGSEADIMREAAALGELLGGLVERYPSPSAQPAQPAEEVAAAAPKDKGGASGGACKAEEVLAVKAETVTDEQATDAALEQLDALAKRGAKMSGERLSKFRALLADLQKLADELAPEDPKGKALEAALGMLDKVNKRMTELEARITAPPVAPAETIPDGQAATDAAPVVEVEKSRRRGPVCGIDINNPNFDPAKADQSITFF